MTEVIKSTSRGHLDHGWLDARHTFSFGDYHEPTRMGYRALRVLNEDRVQAARGFGWHGHRDMEIVTWVLEGTLAHEDSMGNGSTLVPGEMQVMSAGRGVQHAERNPSSTEVLHLLQIWIMPETRGLEPGYQERRIDPALLADRLCLLVSRSGRDDSLIIHQDAELFVARISAGKSVAHELARDRHAFIQVARGAARIGGHDLSAGDALTTSAPGAIPIAATSGGAEILLFDLS